MGWLTLRRADPKEATLPTPTPTRASKPVSGKISAYSEHKEDIAELGSSKEKRTSTFQGKSYVLHDPSTPDSDLPYIDAAVVTSIENHWKKASSSSDQPDKVKDNEKTPAWIVIDNIIYDCTFFQHTHPGGEVVIRSFVGQDCSWQFWRFHGKRHMDEFGRELRVGRTSGIQNRFKEPPRYVGSDPLDDW